MNRARIAVVGSINVDIVVRATRFVRPGETMHGDSFALALGGKGANQAVAAAKLGAEVCFVGRTGTDAFGAMARERLAAFGLDLTHVAETTDTGTGIATIAVDSTGQNAITIVAGANARVSPADVAAAADALSRAQMLMLQCETPFAAALAAAQRVRAAGGRVILDPAPAPEEGLPADLLAAADIITPNESEAAILTGIAVSDGDSARAACAALRARGAGIAVVKLGGAGLVYDTGLSGGFLPAFSVRTIDTVAAGDSFNAGLAVALAEGIALPRALRFAAACGALATTKAGASEAAPLRAEVENLLSSLA